MTVNVCCPRNGKHVPLHKAAAVSSATVRKHGKARQPGMPARIPAKSGGSALRFRVIPVYGDVGWLLNIENLS